MKGIVWLASYPKSGNTWVRILLSNLIRGSDAPVSINALDPTPIASARHMFDDRLGIAASDLTPREIARLRPRLYEDLARGATGPLFLKVHDARLAEDGVALFPTTATAGVVYIIRDPRDVAISFAHHMGVTIDKAIERMSQDSFSLAATGARLAAQLEQRLSTWSGHASSWLDHDDFPKHVVRYEDLQTDPSTTLSKLALFAGLTAEPGAIDRAVSHSAFEELRRQEDLVGFRERPPAAERFFREGKAGQWRTGLTPAQVEAISRDHAVMMRRFGYDPSPPSTGGPH